VRVEQSIGRISTPASAGPEAFLRRFLAPAAPVKNGRPAASVRGHWVSRLPPVAGWSWWHRQDPRWRALASGCLAASLLFLTLILLLWGPEDRQFATVPAKQPMTDVFLAQLFDRDVQLSAAATPRLRVEILTDLAGDLHRQTRNAATRPDLEDLAELAKLYGDVLTEGVLKGANKIPPEQRAGVITPLAKRIADMGEQADRLAQELSGPPAGALRQIAQVSRQTDNRLRALVQEQRS
jgi:hypothetical protein